MPPPFPRPPIAVTTEMQRHLTASILGNHRCEVKVFKVPFKTCKPRGRQDSGSLRCTVRLWQQLRVISHAPFHQPSAFRPLPTQQIHPGSAVLCGIVHSSRKIFITHQASPPPPSPGRILFSMKCTSKFLFKTPKGQLEDRQKSAQGTFMKTQAPADEWNQLHLPKSNSSLGQKPEL